MPNRACYSRVSSASFHPAVPRSPKINSAVRLRLRYRTYTVEIGPALLSPLRNLEQETLSSQSKCLLQRTPRNSSTLSRTQSKPSVSNQGVFFVSTVFHSCFILYHWVIEWLRWRFHSFHNRAGLIMRFPIGNGEFIIVLDSQDRENEGDLIIAAESITDAQMAFLVRHTSGLICAPVTPEIANRLELPQMVVENTDPKGTAYTISVDANHPSITTGISAQDRALACRTLASPSARPGDFRRPGHIIPLQAKSGGVRQRKGHTEAAVEFCRLAGKAPAGVIAELVEDGEIVEGVPEISGNNGMMRRDGCLKFGRKWGIKVCTIEDLVEYLERTEGPSSAVSNGKH